MDTVRMIQAAREDGTLSDAELVWIYHETYGENALIADERQLAIYRAAFGEDPPAELMEEPPPETKEVELGSAFERMLELGMAEEKIRLIYKEEASRAYRKIFQEFRSRGRTELASGDVARIQKAAKEPITGAKKRKISASLALNYRDARDRARRVADDAYYPGLITLMKQALQTGDEMLAAAVWDECDERDRHSPGLHWRQTIEFGISPSGS